VILFKVVTTALAVLLAGLGARVAVLVGIALAQVSEFSFVVGSEARRLGILAPEHVQPFLATVVLSMLASPFVYRPAHALADRFDAFVRRRTGGRRAPEVPVGAGIDQHVVLVGYGLTGRNVGRALTDHGVPFVAIEMNPETVRGERAKGVRVLYGDAGHPEVLLSAGIDRARLLVVAINDAAGSLRVVRTARVLRPDLRLVVRARYLREVEALRLAGAEEVVPDEVETSVEIFARVLKAYDLPADAIERSVRAVRADTFAAVRGAGAREGFEAGRARMLSHVDLEFHVVGPGAPADGRTIGDLGIRKAYGATVVAVRRGGEIVPEPGAGTRLEAADVVVVMGTPDRLAWVAGVFRPPAAPEAAAVEKPEGA
jgi:CPA2 family monovalent cation:H+ antiporter-2